VVGDKERGFSGKLWIIMSLFPLPGFLSRQNTTCFVIVAQIEKHCIFSVNLAHTYYPTESMAYF
jgi:hypothetical protein